MGKKLFSLFIATILFGLVGFAIRQTRNAETNEAVSLPFLPASGPHAAPTFFAVMVSLTP